MKNSKKLAIRAGLVAGFMLALASVGLITMGAPPAPLPAPDWAAIFSPDGTVTDMQGGLDAVFLEDKVSDGVGIDMTVSADHVDHSRVDNGIVAAAHDLGNGYVWATTNVAGEMLLYAGVERLDSLTDTSVEFEFNQGIVRVFQGRPWPIRGSRTEGDLLVRVNFTGGAISSGEFLRWDGVGSWIPLISGPEGCAQPDYRFCTGPLPMQSVQADVWDAAYNAVQVRQPNNFLEIGINVASLLGSNIEFTSIQVRTPEDVILNSFDRIGLYARRGQGGSH